MMSGWVERGSREQAKRQWYVYLCACVEEQRRIDALRAGKRGVGLRLGAPGGA